MADLINNTDLDAVVDDVSDLSGDLSNGNAAAVHIDGLRIGRVRLEESGLHVALIDIGGGHTRTLGHYPTHDEARMNVLRHHRVVKLLKEVMK